VKIAFLLRPLRFFTFTDPVIKGSVRLKKNMKNLLLILILSLMMLFSVTHATGQTNIALGKKVHQSSDGFPDLGKASAAVDGNTNGNYGARSVTHTKGTGEMYPRWEIDLEANYRISEIKIWNRTDCCSERLNNLLIMVSDVKNNQTYNFGPYPSAGNMNPFILPVNVTGSHVTVMIDEENAILSLAEVEIFGVPERQPPPTPAPTPVIRPTPPPIPLVNLSKEGGMMKEQSINVVTGRFFDFSYQSSNLDDTFGLARTAIDGNRSGNYSTGSVSHTKEENQPFWQIDLGDIQDIREIRIYNRTDCCQERLDNFRIIVSEKEIRRNTDGILYAQGGYNYEKINPFVFKKSVRAQFVRIYLVGRGYLSLAEVEIMGIDNYKECVQWERGACVQRAA
jgi:hypothetical protein